ncbi:hypothetical protein AZI11_02215 [Levilactobacillus brevis]|uniref:hypothetical protein n=1 Tax=Levilactobacillus brevis TaxID=1580 RepID=UPI000A204618|nr:hypothetical protein [Levilactobacillus brevis]ARN91806.1 hypothetical protein AZI11_02215 [Levilactobacillus brevis]ARN94528.1 hypothetical protein AZI12_02235 [Levilactobacillus brevis]
MTRRGIWTGIFLIFAIFLGFGIKQYVAVNSQGQEAVIEKFFDRNQWVRAENVKFKVLKVENHSTTREKRIKVFLRIQQDPRVNIGGIKGNVNIADASWLNIPYSISNPSETVRKVSGHPFTEQELKNSKEKIMVLDFDSPVDNYKQRQRTARVSFLLVDDQTKKMIKYSLPVNL